MWKIYLALVVVLAYDLEVECQKLVCSDGRGKTYSVGQSYADATCTGWCTCRQGGHVSCVSLCPPYTVRCGLNEIKQTKQVAVPGTNCNCTRPVCVKKPTTCKYGGKTYSIGQSFDIAACRARCTCKQGGRISCETLCPRFNLICAPNQVMKFKRGTVPGSSCYCWNPFCVNSVK